MRQIVDGNTACSMMAYLFSEVASIYPITPSSPMASNMDAQSSKLVKNLFDDIVHVTEMESEAGAAGAMHGALLAGSLASTFTASQGLLLMIPNMYKMAGECLPGVIHVASRTVATHALSIFGDHSDIYATRATGFCHLASSNPQEAYHLAAVAHLASIKASLPFLHFFDGFRTSHELNVIETLGRDNLLALIDQKKLKEFRERSLNIGEIKQYGMSETEDVYFQSMEARNTLYEMVPDIVNEYMQKINTLADTHYAPFEYFGDKDATSVVVAMGSVCDTIKLVVEEERKKGKKIGCLTVHLYRPFSKKYFLDVLPETVKKVAVLDRTKESGASGEPLYLDVLAVLKDKDIQVVGGRYGLSSKNTTPSQIYAVFKMLEENPQNNFTIGIVDDVTKRSLPTYDYEIPLKAFEIQIYGFGSDGMVSASKDIMHIIGEKDYVQGYFEYDSKKSGGVTVSHLRVSKETILAPYYVTACDLIVVTKDEYFGKYAMLNNAKDGSVLLINTKDEQKCLEKMTLDDIECLKKKKMKVLTVDADKIAMKHHIPGKISKIMEIIILNLLGEENALNILNQSIWESFHTKGEDVVKNNQEAILEACQNVRKLQVIDKEKKEQKVLNNIFAKMNARLGNELTVSEVMPISKGEFPGGLTSLEKRKISPLVSKWIPENCIQCGMCSFVCPHAVIRPFLVKDESKPQALGASEYQYFISVSEADCTGCGLCVKICPGKNGKKALYLGRYDEEKQKEADSYFHDYENPLEFPKFTIKGSQLMKPKFAFSGACAGCGETAYIKLLTQLFGEEIVIANATGCSSIYGGSAPSTPYTIPWANSLFEDNAEFAYGLHLSYHNKREQIANIMEKEMNMVSSATQKLFKEWLANQDDVVITKKVAENLEKEDLSQELVNLKTYIQARTVWAIGGDGWAYDIGFGGIDHVLSSEENIKILVLDTEVYSNTGGQMSKSSHVGQVAEFANLGKRSHKKDLFRIAMSYPNCYVASISLGANMMQTLKVFKEAQEHKGPSIIIAYAPCIEHGIKGGMSCTNEEQKLAVEVGYTILMRYKPEEEKLYIDSKTPDFTRYQEFLNREVRYHSLKIKNEKMAQELLKNNQETAMKRYAYYEKLSKDA